MGFVDKAPKRQPIYPRKFMIPSADSSDASAFKESSRHFAKQSEIRSGQGEVLNQAEMQKIITRFGYGCNLMSDADESKRKTFITESLKQNRPVLFAYMEGGDPGKACMPVKAYSAGCGSHWALLINEIGGFYTFIDPHWPNSAKVASKVLILMSNAAADDGQKYSGSFPGIQRSVKEESKGGMFKTKTYDLGLETRQQLKNVLVSVF